MNSPITISIGNTPIKNATASTNGYVVIDGQPWLRLSNSHLMPPFFMSLVSATDLWMYIASNGALTAGRGNPNNALFPYYSADKLLDMVQSSGPQTIIRLTDESGKNNHWAPFSQHAQDSATIQNIYKNLTGSKLIFEEYHPTEKLVFRYRWELSQRYGVVRTSQLVNQGTASRRIALMDGFLNVMPPGVDENFQRRYSNLLDAYKLSELHPETALGVYYLSSIPTDRAEPSEGLRASVVWQRGLPNPQVCLREKGLADFRLGRVVQGGTPLRGQRGAYLTHSRLTLMPHDATSWTTVANPGQDQINVTALLQELQCDDVLDLVRDDIDQGEEKFLRLIAAADGLQVGENRLRCHRHQTNVIFNLLRGGTPLDGYQIPIADWLRHVANCNRISAARHANRLEQQPQRSSCSRYELIQWAASTEDLDLLRIAHEYLPLTLGRRHGDPTRPWNSFSIEIQDDDGLPLFNYQGNWRDLFQNWEALGFAFPGFLDGMVLRFLNASTADGYNPYRVTKDSFEWEELDPTDPWANIGYWGDHQIVYLLKLLEALEKFDPQGFRSYLELPLGVYAHVPYRIRNYEHILQDPFCTIDYDNAAAQRIQAQAAEIGADGQLQRNCSGDVHRVCIWEKLILPALVKMANFIPDAGIWLNTQRPEWNDANNALVGNGASMVTVHYLRRYLAFLKRHLQQRESESIPMSVEVALLLKNLKSVLKHHRCEIDPPRDEERGMVFVEACGPWKAQSRRVLVDQLQQAGSDYRMGIYETGFSGDAQSVANGELIEWVDLSLAYLQHSIHCSQRKDGLYHAYNLVQFDSSVCHVEHLQEMLEGQVAALSSQLLTPEDACDLIDALRSSALYREDVNSYILYPDRQLPSFLNKNQVDSARVSQSRLLQLLLMESNPPIIKQDANRVFRFQADFRNADDLMVGLDNLQSERPELSELIQSERLLLRELFIETFEHRRFTGRSGTFFAYEGLGSVYWHMVSKLLLAIGETINRAVQESVPRETLQRLKQHYWEVRNGLGVESLPSQYGAFPTDPYSHTPQHAGAQQPGMTGQVKEDILTRWMELGVQVDQGIIEFVPTLFENNEFLSKPTDFHYFDQAGNQQVIALDSGSFAFTFCQVPVIYRRSSDQPHIRIHFSGFDQSILQLGRKLTSTQSRCLFQRDQTIAKIEVFI